MNEVTCEDFYSLYLYFKMYRGGLAGDGIQTIIGRLMNEKCGPDPNQSNPITRIINGQKASHHEYPWQVSIKSRRGSHFCGGSIIDTHHILTAAHCVEGKGPNSMFVHLSEHVLGSTEDGVTKKFAVDRVVAHSQFHMEYMWHDIAILRLREPIKFNYNYNPVQLPLDHSYDYSGRNATVTGFGDSNFEYHNVWLKEYTANVMDPETCAMKWNRRGGFRTKISPDDQICLETMRGSACYGDSGGPLIVCTGNKCTQVGIVSFGMMGCKLGHNPAIFTRTSNYLNWIAEMVSPLPLLPLDEKRRYVL